MKTTMIICFDDGDGKDDRDDDEKGGWEGGDDDDGDDVGNGSGDDDDVDDDDGSGVGDDDDDDDDDVDVCYCALLELEAPPRIMEKLALLREGGASQLEAVLFETDWPEAWDRHNSVGSQKFHGIVYP